MKVISHNMNNEDTVYATVQLRKTELLALREYMHCKSGDVEFPHQVTLVYRGRGWYRLEAGRAHRAIDNITFALTTLKRFYRWHADVVTEELKRLSTAVVHNVKPIAFSSMHSAGEYTFAGAPTTKQPPQMQDTKQQRMTEQAVSRLHNLAAKFGHQLKTA